MRPETIELALGLLEMHSQKRFPADKSRLRLQRSLIVEAYKRKDWPGFTTAAFASPELTQVYTFLLVRNELNSSPVRTSAMMKAQDK